MLVLLEKTHINKLGDGDSDNNDECQKYYE